MKRLTIHDFRLTIGALALLALPFCASAQRPTSLGGSSMMTADSPNGTIQRRTALHKGDHLTVVVSETMSGQYAASTTTAKTASASTDATNIPVIGAVTNTALKGLFGGAAPQKLINALLGANSSGGKESVSGSGTTTSSNALSGAMSVEVVGVEPNGDLQIRGVRTIRMNKETQKMILTGVVRPDDIDDANRIASSMIANADIEVDGKGAVSDKTKKGIISRILGWVF